MLTCAANAFFPYGLVISKQMYVALAIAFISCLARLPKLLTRVKELACQHCCRNNNGHCEATMSSYGGHQKNLRSHNNLNVVQSALNVSLDESRTRCTTNFMSFDRTFYEAYVLFRINGGRWTREKKERRREKERKNRDTRVKPLEK